MYGYLKDWPAAIQMQPAILPLAGCHSAERCTGELEVCREQRTDRPRALPLWHPDTQPFPAHTRVSSERGESGRNIAKNNSSNNLIESFIWIRDYQCVVIIHLYEDMWWLSLDILQISTQQQMAHWQTLIPCRTESLTDNLTTQYHQANQTWTRPAWKQTKAANSGSLGPSWNRTAFPAYPQMLSQTGVLEFDIYNLAGHINLPNEPNQDILLPWRSIYGYIVPYTSVKHCVSILNF